MNAVKGDGFFARRVGDHYDFVKLDYANAIYWYTIGAENDNLSSQQALYIHFLAYKQNNDFLLRGIFWVYKLAVVGYPEVGVSERALECHGYTLETARPPDDALFPFNYVTLSEQVQEQCKEGALKGSGKAALIMAQYFSETAKDAGSAEYWYQIGAQNGNVECQYQYGSILAKKSDKLDKERGNFWHIRALENGYIMP